MSSSEDYNNNSAIVLGQVTRINHPGYNMSKKHLNAQQEIAEILCFGFHRVFIECDAPVPNPARYLYGDMKARSTKPYDLDVFAEDPIWENLVSLKHQKIAVEIAGPNRKGHNNKYQLARDDARKKQIRNYYNIPIFEYSCHEVVGQGYRHKLKKLIPPFTATEFLGWWNVVLKQNVMELLKMTFQMKKKDEQ
ncbi:MAG: hypothetical protein R2685_08075 [Candidatus Nitrosocosmicus sp.]|nr:hypothetical protein [Candidatus Nitrosocosmicus sp.]